MAKSYFAEVPLKKIQRVQVYINTPRRTLSAIKQTTGADYVLNGTLYNPLHGTSPETARPFVPVQGAHDLYRAGEYMIWTDGGMYRCLRDTNFSPEDYPSDWQRCQAAPEETS